MKNTIDNDVDKVLLADRKTNQSLIRQSGNSDVDVKVQVDTTPIAYAMLCSLLATKQLSKEEFETAVSKLEDLTNSDRNDLFNSTFNETRRRWI